MGLKCDLRDNPDTLAKLEKEGKKIVSKQEIDELAKEIEADGYVEVSALKRHNVDLVFETAMRSYFTPKIQPKKKMCILL